MDKAHSGAALKRSLQKVRHLTKDKFIVVLQKLSMDAFREVVLRSAYDTGYLRSGWAVTVKAQAPDRVRGGGSPDSNYRDAAYPNVEIKENSIITIYNNTEYAIHLENGTANMAAQPMIEPTYQMLERTTKLLADKLSREKLDV